MGSVSGWNRGQEQRLPTLASMGVQAGTPCSHVFQGSGEPLLPHRAAAVTEGGLQGSAPTICSLGSADNDTGEIQTQEGQKQSYSRGIG